MADMNSLSFNISKEVGNIDTRTELINDIECKLGNTLTQEQLENLDDVLYTSLDKYEVQERCTDVVITDDTPIQILQNFTTTKSIEGLSKNTLRRYYEACYMLLCTLNKQLNDITAYDIRLYLANYKQQRGVSNRTLDGMRRCYSSFFSWCYAEEIINRNPCAAVSQIKYDKTIHLPFTDVEIEKIKRACPTRRDRALVEFLYATGCRVSEVVALNRDDVDYKGQTAIVMGKGGKERVVYLTDVATFYLEEYLEERTDEDICLFYGKRGRLSKTGIEARLHKIGKLAGVDDVHPHRYRRTLATNLLNRGADIQDVACVLGHEDVKTTQIYCFVSQQNVGNTYNKYIS